MLARTLVIAMATWALCAASAGASPPTAGKYAGTAGKKDCGKRGKAACKASATVREDGTTSFRWAFRLHCSVRGRHFTTTLTSAPLTLGSEHLSADGRVAYTHVYNEPSGREGVVTSVIAGTFEPDGFRGTVRTSMVYKELAGRGEPRETATCRTKPKAIVRLVLKRI